MAPKGLETTSLSGNRQGKVLALTDLTDLTVFLPFGSVHADVREAQVEPCSSSFAAQCKWMQAVEQAALFKRTRFVNAPSHNAKRQRWREDVSASAARFGAVTMMQCEFNAAQGKQLK